MKRMNVKNIAIAGVTTAALLTGLTACGGSGQHPTTNRTPTAASDPATAYQDWLQQVSGNLSTVASFADDGENPKTCEAVMPNLDALANGPLPPIDTADWVILLADTRAGLEACVEGDMVTADSYGSAIESDTTAFEDGVNAVLPGTYDNSSTTGGDDTLGTS